MASEPTTGDIPGTSAKGGLEAAATVIAKMRADLEAMAKAAKEINKAFQDLKAVGQLLGGKQGAQAPTVTGGFAGASAIPPGTTGALPQAKPVIAGVPQPQQQRQPQGPRAGFGARVEDLGQPGSGAMGDWQIRTGSAADNAKPSSLPQASQPVDRRAQPSTTMSDTAASVTAHVGDNFATSSMSGGRVSGGAVASAVTPTPAAATPVGGLSGGATVIPTAAPAAQPSGSMTGGGGTGLTENEMYTGEPVGSMIGSGQGSGEAGGGMGAIGLVMKGLKFAGGMAMGMINDLRFGRDEGLRYERSRLIAFGGTSGQGEDRYRRFRQNLTSAMNGVNVQDRTILERDVGEAFGSYYSQGFGGDQQGGDIRTARTVGAMHTLASVAGIRPEYVGGALDSMYSSQAYYKAMASGIMTRDPTTGDMMTTEEIVNQYRGRFSNNTPDQIRRAMAPGGAFAAELKQTWGGNEALIQMITEGILTTSTTGKAIEAGKMHEAVSEAGYAGTMWTQGKDSEAQRLEAEEKRLALYANYITEGISSANAVVEALNNMLGGLSGPLKGLVGAMEYVGGALDTFNTTMPETTQKMVEAIESLISKLFGWLTGPLEDIIGIGIGGGASEGDWFVNKNKPVNVHQGEMILPNRIATAVRSELQMGQTSADTPSIAFRPGTNKAKMSGSPASVNIYVTVQNASDAETMRFAQKVKRVIEGDNELAVVGTGQFG